MRDVPFVERAVFGTQIRCVLFARWTWIGIRRFALLQGRAAARPLPTATGRWLVNSRVVLRRDIVTGRSDFFVLAGDAPFGGLAPVL